MNPPPLRSHWQGGFHGSCYHILTSQDSVLSSKQKEEAKAPSPHLHLSRREQGFSQKPQQTLLDTSLAGTRSPDQLWLQEELRGKNEVFPYFISGSGLCQVGTAGCLCLHTKPGERETVCRSQAKGERLACLALTMAHPVQEPN